ncbi:hypothetical protein Psta_2277 [Pirellula staleyi DSM 6068]|uniref:Uncharacterized protein n=1 Tax=Pirellula staleyi (strain ATCC 27377 / DSM 6068 / ICPB 4128) TaxID=530564 RepID=D2R3J3_PIRSD|nr:hypothetical protein [Pirellula staleyi]ADB16947.1 hypothetical protein Psta_2277 [Pirellula staleyi DSM 6068]
MPLDADSIKCLETVKRGTPARFVAASKGGKIVGCVVYRKGGYDGHAKRAKESGGTLCFGVVNGTGAALVFNLARADKFEAAPTKDLALREYVNEGNDLKLKPVFAIINTLPVVADDDNDAAGYLSLDEWRERIEGIRQAQGFDAKKELLKDEATVLSQEASLAKLDPALQANPERAAEVGAVHAKVREVLQGLSAQLKQWAESSSEESESESDELDTPRQMPPVPATPNRPRANMRVNPGPTVQQQPVAPVQQVPVQPVAPVQPVPVQPVAPVQQAPAQPAIPPLTQAEQQVRNLQNAMSADVARKGAAINGVKPPFTSKEVKDIMTEVESDAASDFGQICNRMVININTGRNPDNYEGILTRCTEGIALAQKYLKDHKDPTIGKLPERVLKRKQYCELFIVKFQKTIDDTKLAEEAALALVKTYGAVAAKNAPPPPMEAKEELEKLLDSSLISSTTKQRIQQVAQLIQQNCVAAGNQALAALPADAPRTRRADIMLRQGCYKKPDSGTSDIRLLKNPDGSIAYAFKSAVGEAPQALDLLGLDDGACAVREELCSAANDEFLRQTGIDLGFPKVEVTTIAGKTGALIDGVRGKMADPEEVSQLSRRDGVPQADIDAAILAVKTLPDLVTPESLQKVVVSALLTNQWDAKWGNMIIENNNARPIDGGGAYPTQKMIDEYNDDINRRGLQMAFSTIVSYPAANYMPQSGQPLPAAQQPMDAALKTAIQQFDPDQYATALTARKNQVVANNPSVAGPNGHDLLPPASLKLTKDSALAMKAILAAKPNISLYDFVTDYETWLKTWLAANATPPPAPPRPTTPAPQVPPARPAAPPPGTGN